MAGGDEGYLVVADITGYTRFLTASELDHARGILEDLFGALTARLTSPLILSHIQGDAILAHAPAQRVNNGSVVFDSVEALYLGFREALAHMMFNTTCPCTACAGIGDLDLKFIVHFGRYIEHDLGGHRELSGPDVILVHRLLKNEVPAQTGIAAYALFTEAAISGIAMDAVFDAAPRVLATDPDLGEIHTRALDMDVLWQAHRARTHFIVEDPDPRFIPDISRSFDAPVDVVWHYAHDPAERTRWFEGIDGLERETGVSGRLAAGTRDHCAHGAGKVAINEYVDVVPLSHVTYDVLLPLDTRLRMSILVEPEGDATKLTIRIARPKAPGPVRAAFWRLLGKLVFEKKMAEVWQHSLENLAALIASDARTGHTTGISPQDGS